MVETPPAKAPTGPKVSGARTIISLVFLVIVLVVWLTWPPGWWLLLLIPAVSITRHAVEVIVGAIVNRERNKLRAEREALLKSQLSTPLQTWLADWPTSGGTSLERLQQVLTRIPASIRELGTLVNPVQRSEQLPPWNFGVQALLANLAQRGLLKHTAP